MRDLLALDTTAAPPSAPGALLPPLVTDSFAGGGGASTGIEAALGRPVDVAINHDATALAMHEANHPSTRHAVSSVWAIDPRDLIAPGQRVGLSWFSPDCKHHSKAAGGKPRSKNIRDLAWVVVSWAERVAPEIIMLENVEEFRDWGPLIPKTDADGAPVTWSDGTPWMIPDPARKGEEFALWCRKLRRLGYVVDWREMRACDYGAPTIRKRLFVIARRDGRPIVWPDPTHGDPKSRLVQWGYRKPWRTAAEIVDWSLPCPSIFASATEIRDTLALSVKRPLADKTLRRIARGLQRYVLEAAAPFVVHVAHGDSGGRREYPIGDPIGTMSAGGTQHGIAVPTLVQTGYGERAGQAPRCLDLHRPLGTVVAGGTKHAVVTGFIAQHNGGPRNGALAGRPMDAPLSTLTTRGTQQQPVAAFLANLRGTASCQHGTRTMTAPAPTVTAGGTHAAAITGFLAKYYGQGEGQGLDGPMHTLTTRDRFGVLQAALSAPPYGPQHEARAWAAADLLRRFTDWTGGDVATVRIGGLDFVIVDIGMRMLTPREQFRAQGFPDDYVIDRRPDGTPITKTQQTEKCGNSVPPAMAEALVCANAPHLAEAHHA